MATSRALKEKTVCRETSAPVAKPKGVTGKKK